MGYTIKYNGKPVEELTPAEKARFDKMGEGGVDEMLRTGKVPLIHTDDTLRTAWDNANGKQFENQPQYGDMALKRAKEAGVSTNGKMYLSGLADSPGDPKAWVDGKADIKRIAEERGMGVEGVVSVKMRDAPTHTIDQTQE